MNNLIKDILPLFGLSTGNEVGANVLATAWDKLCRKRLEENKDIILEEIEQGNFDNIGDDEKISFLHRYAQATINGTARLNLRILAKVMNSLAKGESLTPSLYATEFNRYAQILKLR